VGVFDQFVEVSLLAGKAAGADELDESIVVDEDVEGVHISNFKVVFLKLRPCAHHAVEQVPQLSLQEEAADLAAVVDLHLEDVGVVVVGELHGEGVTLTSPVEPHRPVDSKTVLLGSRSTSLVMVSSILLTYLYQRLNSASDSITLVIVICSCGLPSSSITYPRETSPSTECCYTLAACGDSAELPITTLTLYH
jgi:hypothetical protein